MQRCSDSRRPSPARRSAVAVALGVAGAVAVGVGGTPAQASYPGVNGKITCSGGLALTDQDTITRDQSRLEIFTIDPDGTNETRLTDDTASDYSPRFSADGTKIAWVREEPNNSPVQVFTMNADGSNRAGPLTTEGSNNWVGDWSPDGSQIVFQSSRDGNAEIYKMDADGSNQVNLTNNAGPGAAAGPGPSAKGHFGARNNDSQPSWSPDGTQIAFQSNRDGNADIHVMNADGTNVTNITPSAPGSESGPRWSPDGQRIAFNSNRDQVEGEPPNHEIYTMKADGSDWNRLTFSAYDADDPSVGFDVTGYDLYPAWSPDGTRIVFHSGRNEKFRTTGQSGIKGQWDVYHVDAVNGEGPGGDIVQVTDRPYNDERCDWQPLAIPAQAEPEPPAQPEPLPPAPVPPVPPAPPVVGPCGDPAAAGYLHPAKVRVSRARVLREDRRLDMLAPITSRARGAEVKVTYEADNRRDVFEAAVTEANTELDRITMLEPITRGQAELGTGIVNLEYLGDEDTRPGLVRLRAASQRAELDVEEISLLGDRLSAQGSVTDRAQGVVRLLYSYVDPDGSPQVHEARATIQDNGGWELDDDEVPPQLAQCGGYLSIQFTGYFERRIRGEQLAYQLNAGQTRKP
jgi:TolB protein